MKPFFNSFWFIPASYDSSRECDCCNEVIPAHESYFERQCQYVVPICIDCAGGNASPSDSELSYLFG